MNKKQQIFVMSKVPVLLFRIIFSRGQACLYATVNDFISDEY
jgi:hypothetical protein